MRSVPLLSVVIPTRNRAEYLEFAIRSVLAIPEAELELIVEDNSDGDTSTSRTAGSVVDVRLSYHWSSQPVSMCENYDRAASRATGEYVCFIGDDDGVNPEVLDAARWAQANDFDAVVPSNPVHFVWPDLCMQGSVQRPGELRIGEFTGKVTLLDAEDELRKCVRDAGQSFHDLPKAYYGLVRRACLERVKDETGSYFPGVSPDLAAAVALASHTKRTCRFDYPLFVPGASRRSNAGISGLRQHVGWLHDQPHLPTTVERDWSKLVPCFYSVETIWAEAAVEALQATHRLDVLADFNFTRVHADCAMWHPRFIPTIAKSYLDALRVTRTNPFAGAVRFTNRYCELVGLRAISLLRRLRGSKPPSDWASIGGLANIDEAVRALSRYLAVRGVRFGQFAGETCPGVSFSGL